MWKKLQTWSLFHQIVELEWVYGTYGMIAEEKFLTLRAM